MSTTFKKLILDDLKSQGRKDIADKIKSITYDTYAGGDAVRVKAYDLGKEQREFLYSLLREYQDGHFDGMQDLYIYDKTNSKARTAKYVQFNHDFTPAVEERLIAKLKDQYAGLDSDAECRAAHNDWLDPFLWRKMNEFENAELEF